MRALVTGAAGLAQASVDILDFLPQLSELTPIHEEPVAILRLNTTAVAAGLRT